MDNFIITRKQYARFKKIESAAEQVLAGLNQRIEDAPPDAKPVFHGIAELHAAISMPGK